MMTKKIGIRLKNGFKYSGELIYETDKKIVLKDRILGELEIDKDYIAVRGDANV